jgi:hypothetical protein
VLSPSRVIQIPAARHDESASCDLCDTGVGLDASASSLDGRQARRNPSRQQVKSVFHRDEQGFECDVASA